MPDSNNNPLYFTDFLNYLEEKKSKKSRKKKKKKKQTTQTALPSLYLGGLGDPTDDVASGSEDGGGDGGVGESFTLKEALRFYWRTDYDDDEERDQFVDDNDEFEADFDDDDDVDRDDILRARDVDFEENEEEETDTKKLKAIDIYNGMSNAERADIIQRFMDELQMTENAAKTYYQKINSGEWVREDFVDEDEAENDEQPSEDEEGDVTQQPDEETSDEGELNDLQDDEPEDPDRQGLIRTVKDAHLVYKRQAEDGSYEELWTYNIDKDVRNELKIRRDILAGTDISPNKRMSDDGSQQYDLWTVGNVQMLHVEGLPN